MLVILQKEQLIPTERVCCNCLWASKNGNPRWQRGNLDCVDCIVPEESTQPKLYQCRMGFRLVNIE